LLVGVACAYATRLLGVYYLVGAFLVGVAAQRFRATHPAMSSEKMVDALESFGSVFIPFYFFHAGAGIHADQLSLWAIIVGLALVVTLVPLRIAVISLHRMLAFKESFAASRRIGSAMIPTLVFTLVILDILVERFGVSPTIGGALVFYTVVNTTLPAFVLRGQPADFEDLEAPRPLIAGTIPGESTSAG
jgi:Kef-type K+ transport system membrane component KefB